MSQERFAEVLDIQALVGRVGATAPSCCAYSDALKLIVAGDDGGHLHSLHLEQPKPKR